MRSYIPVANSPLTVALPAALDTNETYKITGPDGDSWDLVYDLVELSWVVLPL